MRQPRVGFRTTPAKNISSCVHPIFSRHIRRRNAKRTSRGGMEPTSGGTMPSFEICYFDDQGYLACSFSAVCDSETHAKVLAHAMKHSDYKTFEVWHERTLVYERPQHFDAPQHHLQ